jgi:hypothetical protein
MSVNERSSEVIEAGRNARCQSVGLARWGTLDNDSDLRPDGRFLVATRSRVVVVVSVRAALTKLDVKRQWRLRTRINAPHVCLVVGVVCLIVELSAIRTKRLQARKTRVHVHWDWPHGATRDVQALQRRRHPFNVHVTTVRAPRKCNWRTGCVMGTIEEGERQVSAGELELTQSRRPQHSGHGQSAVAAAVVAIGSTCIRSANNSMRKTT